MSYSQECFIEALVYLFATVNVCALALKIFLSNIMKVTDSRAAHTESCKPALSNSFEEHTIILKGFVNKFRRSFVVMKP